MNILPQIEIELLLYSSVVLDVEVKNIMTASKREAVGTKQEARAQLERGILDSLMLCV